MATPMPVMVTVSPVGGMPWNSPSVRRAGGDAEHDPVALRMSPDPAPRSGNAAANVSTIPEAVASDGLRRTREGGHVSRPELISKTAYRERVHGFVKPAPEGALFSSSDI